MTARWWLSMALVVISACSDESPAVVLVGLEDGAVVGGAQTAVVESEAALDRVELYLGGDRIGADDQAPFSFEWNTLDHEEGSAVLRARAVVADGSAAEDAVDVVLDNTAPVVLPPPSLLRTREDVQLHASDAHRVVRVVLSGDGIRTYEDADPPFVVNWREGCGSAEVTITAIDEAGWEGTWTGSVDTLNRADDDCDGHEAVDQGGGDCDDRDPAVSPDQVDAGESGDPNCDGVAGTDADGDGIAALGLGGLDCDDSNPAIHPHGHAYERVPLEIDGEPLVWEPGTASLVWRSRNDAVAINRGGTLELVSFRAEPGARTELLRGINPGPVALVSNDVAFDDPAELSIFYSVGNELRIHHRRGDDDWTDALVLTADEELDQPIATEAFSLGRGGRLMAAVRAGTSLYVAIQDGAGWQTQLLETGVDRSPALLDLDRSFLTASLTYVVGTEIRRVTYGVEDPPFLTIDGLLSTDPSQVAGLCFSHDGTYYEVDDALVKSDAPGASVAPRRPGVRRLFCEGGDIHVQSDSDALLRFDTISEEFDYAVITADIADQTGPGISAFASPGVVFQQESILAPDDPEDGVDRDCDGRDFRAP